mmetsp:Transcript_18513/g.62463  ORF Transcript_18513/g.62463 Transcript_18513/m.62463 type:complete len:220 (-) Transcript_18513:14-673(-)
MYVTIPVILTTDSIDHLNTQVRSEPISAVSALSREASQPETAPSKKAISCCSMVSKSLTRKRRKRRACAKSKRNTFQKSSAALTQPVAKRRRTLRFNSERSPAMAAPRASAVKCGAQSENGRRRRRAVQPRAIHFRSGAARASSSDHDAVAGSSSFAGCAAAGTSSASSKDGSPAGNDSRPSVTSIATARDRLPRAGSSGSGRRGRGALRRGELDAGEI